MGGGRWGAATGDVAVLTVDAEHDSRNSVSGLQSQFCAVDDSVALIE